MLYFEKLLGLIFLIFFLSSSNRVNGQTKENRVFIWGINGHPFTQQAYNKRTWAEQLSFLKDLKVDYYRIDVPLANTGRSKNEAAFYAFVRQLKSIDVKPMPAVFPRIDTTVIDSLNTYNLYYEQGKTFAKEYGDLIDVVEVGNEWETKLIKSRKLDGTRASHYDLVKAKKRMWLLQGFINGMKTVKSSLRVSISLGWTHWYYLELLEKHHVNYDIIGYHWYSDMGDITNARKPYGDFLPTLKEKYRKEIWVTEFNTHAGTVKHSFASQKDYIAKSIERILKHKVISGLFIYELFDQPALKPRYPDEPNYGLIYMEGNQRRLKPAYLIFRQFIASTK